MKAINVDWSNQEGAYEGKWEFIGRELAYSEQEKEDNPDDGYPMMNYAYPLEDKPDKETIIKITTETNCTVVYNNQDDQYYLALTGGGMDLSQDIALAYIWAQGFIDWDMLDDIYIDSAFSVSDKNFKLILKQLQRQMKAMSGNYERKLVDIANKLK